VTASGFTKSGADAGNYVFADPQGTTTADITPATLSVSFAAADKVYDTTTTATIKSSPAPSLVGVLGSDTVTLDGSGASASFANKNVGNGKTVTASGFTKSGADAGNYVFADPQGTTTADITRADLDIYAATDSKVYDGGTSSSGVPTVSGLKGNDTVTGTTQAFQSKNVLGAGNSALTVTGYAVNDGNSGANYNVTTHTNAGTINPATLDIYAAADSRTYNGTTNSNGVPTLGTGQLKGGDTVDGLTQGFTSKNALGAGLSTLHVTGYVVHDGNSGGNYNVTLHDHSGTISPALLAVSGITANNKVWDGTPSATLNTGAASLVGVIGTDSVTLVTSGATGTFSSSGVGTWPVTISGVTITGADAGNYSLSVPPTNASILAWNANGKGFYAPVGADAAHSIFTAANTTPTPTTLPSGMVWNTIKGGQTVPLKFNIFAGSTEMTGANAFPASDLTKAFQAQKLNTCVDPTASDPVDFTTTGQTTLRYDTTAMQWIQNWATPKVATTTCYRTWVTFADGSTLEAFFQLSK
jgi:hypothetical protein